ncbi:MAG TPA: AMP-dependent synthetase/ligase [Microthrixaceae bacterium]|nr:AMP-dependent synthetase/ligase [Microthrixaceae bacterium]
MPSTDAEINERIAGRTVPTEFMTMVGANPGATAVRWMVGDDGLESLTFAEVAERVAHVAGGLRELGVGPGDLVVIMLRNIPEFHWVDLGVLFCGATPVSIYNSSSPEQVQYLASHCHAKVAVVEDEGFLERFLKVRDELPELEAIVTLHDPEVLPEGVHPWSTLADASPIDLAEGATIAKPDDLATVIYTSGTTGNPKGVMLSHHNLVWTGESMLESFEWTRDDSLGSRLVSYLPMAHIAERMVSHYGMVFFGYDVTCCPDPTAIATYAKEVHPNIIFGVPRVWEKIYAGVQAALGLDPEKKAKFDEAVAAAAPIRERMTWGTATDEDLATYEFLDSVAFSTVRGLVGLDEVRLAVTGAAPIPAELVVWFRAIGVPLAEVYGLSETTGPMTFAAFKVKPGSVGPQTPGCTVRIADDGEVICKGGNVFVGYLDDPEKTAEAIDDEGWFHSGDIGELDEDGYVRIVDRKKELIITAGGKNISPANLEAALKTIPLVAQAAAVGDNRPFVAALVVLDPEVAPVWAERQGLGGIPLQELAEHEVVVAEVEAALETAMANFNHAERVKKVRILGEEWLPDSDVLTPTSKLKRRGIHARYSVEIEALYG